MGDVIENVAVFGAYTDAFAKRRECKAGTKVADQGREADLLEQQAQAEGKGNPDRFNHNRIPFFVWGCPQSWPRCAASSGQTI